MAAAGVAPKPVVAAPPNEGVVVAAPLPNRPPVLVDAPKAGLLAPPNIVLVPEPKPPVVLPVFMELPKPPAEPKPVLPAVAVVEPKRPPAVVVAAPNAGFAPNAPVPVLPKPPRVVSVWSLRAVVNPARQFWADRR